MKRDPREMWLFCLEEAEGTDKVKSTGMVFLNKIINLRFLSKQ